MNDLLHRILDATDHEQLMAATQSACARLGRPLLVRFFCRGNGPLLMEARAKQPGSDEQKMALTNSVANTLGGITDGFDGILKLIELRRDFKCPGRTGAGDVIRGTCAKCNAVLEPE